MAAVGQSRRRGEFRRRARPRALLVHRRLEARHVDAHAALAADVGGQVHREAVGVVELEYRLAVEQFLAGSERRLEQRHAVLQRLGEALFLLAQDVGDPVLRRAKLRISVAHRLVQVFHQPVEERLLLAELVAVSNGAAHDPAQDIAASLVSRNHAVDDQEGAGANVVRDHVQGRILQAFLPGFPRRGPDQVLEQVDVVIGVLALQHGGDALEAHAGVDAGLGQRRERAGGVAVVLHEHQVPDLDVAVAVGVGRPGRPAGDARPVVVENLAAGTARPGIGHLPEVVRLVFLSLVADAHHALFRQADGLGPQLIGLVVGLVDRGPELLRRQSVHLGEQLPRELDRVLLEVVAEAEVAQHLEEGVVARGVADVFQVVVLAPGAQAALRGGGAHVGALLLAGEYVLELHHARVHEQERRVVGGNQRARSDDRVPRRAEILEEARANLA